MRSLVTVPISLLLCLGMAAAQSSDSGLAGTWKLNSTRSNVRNLMSPPDPVLRVEQSAKALTVIGSAQENGPASTTTIYPLDGSEAKHTVGGATASTMTKWEGSALLVNTLVSGLQNYSVAERWSRSRDGATLTIRRTIVRQGHESESVLVYNNAALPAAVSSTPAQQATDSSPQVARDAAPRLEAPAEFVVAQGTRVLLRLTNAVDTKRTAAGDRLYLETAVPVFVNGRLVIPRGSYVTGTVTESKQSGRVKGRSALNLRFESLTLPNGVTRDFRSLPGSVDTRGNLDRTEGRIEGEGNKAGDTRTVGQTTAAGASIGTIAGASGGHYGMGAGIGAAAGAVAGLAGVLGSRGPQVILPAGTTMELVLDRDLRYTAAELSSRP